MGLSNMAIAKTIPWVTSGNSQMSVWLWKTEHFTAKISSNRGSFTWQVSYPEAGLDKVLYDDMADDFPEAETRIRELVGKSFPKQLGYAKYAGNLANTFRVNNGVMFDFTTLIGSQIELHYRTRTDDGKRNVEYKVYGTLEVLHYSVVIRTRDGGGLQIPPASVVRLIGSDGSIIPLEERKKEMRSRVYKGIYTPRCTGKPGAVPGTVEHPEEAPSCPVHE